MSTVRITAVSTSSEDCRLAQWSVWRMVSTPCRRPVQTRVALFSIFAIRTTVIPDCMPRFSAVFLPILDGVNKTDCMLNYFLKIGGLAKGVSDRIEMGVEENRFKVCDIFKYLTLTLPIRLKILKLRSDTKRKFIT